MKSHQSFASDATHRTYTPLQLYILDREYLSVDNRKLRDFNRKQCGHSAEHYIEPPLVSNVVTHCSYSLKKLKGQ
jgi:hypothetical protein